MRWNMGSVRAEASGLNEQIVAVDLNFWLKSIG
jgi:hypothetical protein